MTTNNLPYEKVGNREPVCIADEVPFEIPDSWEWVRISTISTVVTKGTTPRGGNVAYEDKGIGFLRAENVVGMDKLNMSNLNYISEDTHLGYLKRSILLANDILITIAGTLGRTAIVREADLPLNANQAVSIVRLVDPDQFNLMYFIYALNSPCIQKALTAQKKITAIPNLTLEIISDCLLPVPPLEEQKRIVHEFQKYISLLEAYNERESKLSRLNESFPDHLKKSILQLAVQGKLVPQDPNDEPASVLLDRIHAEKEQLIKSGKIKRDKHESVIYRRDNSHYEMVDGVERCIDDEIPFNLPQSWQWCRLKEIANVVSARRVHQSDWRSEGIPFYRAREIAKLAEFDSVNNELFISQEMYDEYSKSGVPQAGDLMVTAVGTLGKTYVVKNTDRFYYKDASVICFENFGKVNPYYLQLVMQAPFMESIIRDNSSGTTVGTITIIKANEYWIPLPPIEEQGRIVLEVKRLVTVCEKL